MQLYELFGDSVPDYGLQIADFRTVGDGGPAEPSPELYDTIDAMRTRQEWMHGFFESMGYESVPFVGSYAGRPMDGATASDLAADVHADLGLDAAWARSARDYGGALSRLKDAVESIGVSVIVSGTVGDNTHRPLDVEEFRGFALADDLAPMIFINGRDAKGAQCFTLVHELAHLAYAQTGVSSPDPESDTGTEAERFCDAVAAEFLVPSAMLAGEWVSARGDAYERCFRIAAAHRVSFAVVARKAHDGGLLGDSEFFDALSRHRKDVASTPARRGSGGDYYNTKRFRLGNVFSDAVLCAVESNYVTYRDAYDLTGLSAPSFRRYFEEVA